MDDPRALAALDQFDRLRPVSARLYRRSGGLEVETGATATLIIRDNERIVEIESGGALPPDLIINVTRNAEGRAAVQDPDDETEDLLAMQIFSLLDPTFVIPLMERTRSYNTGSVVRIVGYVRLDHLGLQIPEAFLDFLKDSPTQGWADWAFDGPVDSRPEHPLDHPVAVLIDRRSQRLVEMRMRDLFPRIDDVIIERFSYSV